MHVTLQNKARRLVCFVLPHAIACAEDHCLCSRQRTGSTRHDPVTGHKHVEARVRKLAGSVTLTAMGHDGDTVKGLPLGVLDVPEIKAAIARRELVATKHPKHAAPAAAPETTPADEADAPTP